MDLPLSSSGPKSVQTFPSLESPRFNQGKVNGTSSPPSFKIVPFLVWEPPVIVYKLTKLKTVGITSVGLPETLSYKVSNLSYNEISVIYYCKIYNVLWSTYFVPYTLLNLPQPFCVPIISLFFHLWFCREVRPTLIILLVGEVRNPLVSRLFTTKVVND